MSNIPNISQQNSINNIINKYVASKNNNQVDENNENNDMKIKILIARSSMLLKLLDFKLEFAKELLNTMLPNMTKTTTIVIELEINVLNTKNDGHHHISRCSFDVVIPFNLMKYLFDKSYLKNMNTHNNLCFKLIKFIDIGLDPKECKKIHTEITHIKSILKYLNLEDHNFAIKFGYDDMTLLHQIIINTKS